MSDRDESGAPTWTQFAIVPQTGRTLAGRYYTDPTIFDADLETSGWQRAQGNLRQVHLEVQLGSLWLNFADQPPSIASHLHAVIAGRFVEPATFHRYAVDRLVIGAVREYQLAANWKLIIE